MPFVESRFRMAIGLFQLADKRWEKLNQQAGTTEASTLGAIACKKAARQLLKLMEVLKTPAAGPPLNPDTGLPSCPNAAMAMNGVLQELVASAQSVRDAWRNSALDGAAQEIPLAELRTTMSALSVAYAAMNRLLR